jgi:hypothetical protein
MLIGDAIHNLRSALDHLAWSLAGTNAGRSTEFPIFVSRTEFSKRGKRKMHGMPTPAQKIIKSLQPYKRPHGLPKEREPLWLLQNLDIEDKHRALNLVASEMMGNVDISTSRDHPAYGLTMVTGLIPLADGAEIFRTTARLISLNCKISRATPSTSRSTQKVPPRAQPFGVVWVICGKRSRRRSSSLSLTFPDPRRW